MGTKLFRSGWTLCLPLEFLLLTEDLQLEPPSSSHAHVPAAPRSECWGTSACRFSPLAPVGTWAGPSCQWVLIIEDWQGCVAAGSGITHGASGASNQLLSGRGNGDLIKSMAHRCCRARTPHSHAESRGHTWKTVEGRRFLSASPESN